MGGSGNSQKKMSDLPDEARNVSNFGTFMSLIRAYVGIAILSLPWIIKHAGIIAGPVMLAFIAIVNSCSMISLVRSSKHLGRKINVSSMEYNEVACYAFLFGPCKRLQKHASKFKFLVTFLIIVTQFGVLCLYVVFIAQNMRQVIAQYCSYVPSDREIMAMSFVPFALLVLIRKLSILAWISAVANVILFTALCMIFRYLLTHLQPVNTRPYWSKIQDFPIFLGTATFSFEGVNLLLPIENVMRHPQDFNKIFVGSMVFTVALSTFMAFTGYLVFGKDICPAITLNLPTASLFYEAIRILYCVGIAVSFSLQFFVLMESIWSPIERRLKPQKIFCEILTRFGLVALICILAIAIPNLGDIFAIVGATAATTLQFIMPSIIELLTFHSKADGTNHSEHLSDNETTPLKNSSDENLDRSEDAITEEFDEAENKGLSYFIIARNIIILSVGLLALVTGTIMAVKKIIDDTRKYSPENTCSGGVESTRSSHQHLNLSIFNNTF